MIPAGQPITVIGAGVAGLAVSLALAQRGAAVTMLEQASAITDIGAGLQISPNGAAVLKALGLGPALVTASLAARSVSLRDGLTDRPVLRMDLTHNCPAGGFHLLHRADLIGLLHAAAVAAGVSIRLNTRLDHVALSGGVPMLHGVGGAPDPAPWLIGADGMHSAVRRALNGPETPFFTHQVAWRATIATPPDTDATVEVHMGPGRHLVSYPLRGGTLRNLVAVEERKDWVPESWSLEDDPDHLRRAFAGFSAKTRGWLAQVEKTHLWGLFRHPVAQTWAATLPHGAVAILGDAAHPTLPFLAQGANMALEDAWVLATSLMEATDPATALAGYQTAREGRCRRLVAAANGNAAAYHLAGLPRKAAHLGLRIGGALMPNFALSRFDWVYGMDVTR